MGESQGAQACLICRLIEGQNAPESSVQILDRSAESWLFLDVPARSQSEAAYLRGTNSWAASKFTCTL